MPWFPDEAPAGGAGVELPGVYSALLAFERACHDDPHYWDPRWMRLQHENGWYCNSPGVVCEHEPPPDRVRRGGQRLTLLEAGEDVVMRRKAIGGNHVDGHHWPGPRPVLPWGDEVEWIRITPDDRVTPTVAPG